MGRTQDFRTSHFLESRVFLLCYRNLNSKLPNPEKVRFPNRTSKPQVKISELRTFPNLSFFTKISTRNPQIPTPKKFGSRIPTLPPNRTSKPLPPEFLYPQYGNKHLCFIIVYLFENISLISKYL